MDRRSASAAALVGLLALLAQLLLPQVHAPLRAPATLGEEARLRAAFCGSGKEPSRQPADPGDPGGAHRACGSCLCLHSPEPVLPTAALAPAWTCTGTPDLHAGPAPTPQARLAPLCQARGPPAVLVVAHG